jgi:hypothetical protein
MTDNEYVATAAAEKRLREVLAARIHGDIDALADAMLSGTRIEYKPRQKAVIVTMTLPDTAEPAAPLAKPEAPDEPMAQSLPAAAPAPAPGIGTLRFAVNEDDENIYAE